MPGPQSPSPTDLLHVASAHITAGRYAEAGAAAQAVLRDAAHNVDALHILGLSLYHLGRYPDAEAALDSAAKGRPSDPAIANSYALTLLKLNRVDDAAQRLEKLARKNKLTAAGLSTLGDCRLRQGQPEKATACFKKALSLQPDLVPALVNYGEALKQSGDLNGAIAHYEKVTARHAQAASAWRNLGLALYEAERFPESISALEKYLAAKPGDIQSQLSLAASRFQTADYEHALSIIESVLERVPDHAEAWNNKGLALRTLERLDAAEEAFAKAIALDPDLTEARTNLGNLIHDVRGLDAALEIFDASIVHGVNEQKAHIARANPLLIEGRIAEGWAEYRWSRDSPAERPTWRAYKADLWSGQDLTGKSILVWGEQGVGDEILYASMMGDVLARAGQVLIECEPRLSPVFERSFPAAQVFPRAYPLNSELEATHFDFHISIADLSPLIRPDPNAFTGGSPYIKDDKNRTASLREKYETLSGNGPVIGIAWHSGRKDNAWLKSIPLQQWTPIFDAKNGLFVSLQYGEHGEEISQLESASGHRVYRDPDIDPLSDLDAFASQVAAMDLVITNSNTAAHFAGALGQSVWIMVPRSGSGGMPWYWMRSGPTSPWYASARLYRQTRFQDWSSVVGAIASDVAGLSPAT
jgi:tetratricopeptide (TPR) repeat protein